ncbi:DUF2125 domain-containing protein [Xinfangfangia sp. CPCC 101601]|uniref:DUF2125 domain-containing protein n=1 Tax=Pseudogemmobacter lacusdianii TaxID=3069608 RepID=A0ABU0VYU2_9RHOB|nr:DUF2125 domain-containing protein [Xinfangfangia sp. CPCC 101601]MDQ2066920.1 DUF2125 domain-containing protein [Xinfangfangia sp. CPCC 101601]
MFHFKTFAAVPALVLLMGGTAHAALTADQVWQSWKDGAAQAGLKISAATESNAGGVLTLNGVSVTAEGETEALTISDITMTEQSDGTVKIAPGATIGIDETDGTDVTKIDLVHDGLSIVASEKSGALVYDFEADSLNVTFDVTTEGYSFDETTEAPAVKNTGKIGFETLSGSYSDTPGANRVFGLDLAAAKFIFDSLADDPGMEMKTTSTSETSDVKIALDVTLPSSPLADLDGTAGMRKALDEGFAIAGSFAQGNGKGTSALESPYFPYSMSMDSEPASAEMSLNKDAFTLTSSNGKMAFNVVSEGMPPMDVSIAQSSMDLKFPVMASTPQDIIFRLKLAQLELSEGVWSMFDPGAELKRDAADLNIDITGRGALDLISLAEAEDMGGEPQIPQLENLDIADISLKVAGAALVSTGAFTFDNSMGFPMPKGNATINVDGANALIDGLIKVGLLEESDAAGARMMMAMFMKPSGNGDDSLVSEIEVKDGMEVLVNGQPLPM